jgi:hypothetical protein
MQRDMRVLEGRAAELERDPTFALLVDALEPLAAEKLSTRASFSSWSAAQRPSRAARWHRSAGSRPGQANLDVAH